LNDVAFRPILLLKSVETNGQAFHLSDAVDSEVAAKERAKQLVDGHNVELWQRDRKIATFTRN
jgi:hypothetical protein